MSKSIRFPRNLVSNRSAKGTWSTEISAAELRDLDIKEGDTLWSHQEGAKKRRVKVVEGIGEVFTDENGEDRVRLYGPTLLEKVEV